jgi:hypothetical protein
VFFKNDRFRTTAWSASQRMLLSAERFANNVSHGRSLAFSPHLAKVWV